MSKNKNVLDLSTPESRGKTSKLALIIASLLLIIALAFSYRYYSNRIEGKWQSNSLDSILQEKMQKDLSEFKDSLKIDMTSNELISKPQLMITVKNNHLQMTSDLSINKKVLIDYIMASFEGQLKEVLKEENLQIDDLSPQMKESIQNAIPSKKIVEQTIDSELTKAAFEVGGHYNSSKGILTTHLLSGRVNPILGTIKITSLNKKADLLLKIIKRPTIDIIN
ncbi:hypothetical protein N1495_05645 [Streptococcus didelphis]|nr:hypothetical protein [Streptococcus didelphis]WMB28995.1 hypothetical protein N1495_05645 [Streptococcus didelphis]